MAGNFIKLTRNVDTATHVQTLLTGISVLKQAYAELVAIRDTMNKMHDGSDFSVLETNFGIPTGQGQTVFDLVNGTVGSMLGNFQVDDAKELIDRVG